MYSLFLRSAFFFFNDTATTEIYTLSLHDALPIFLSPHLRASGGNCVSDGSMGHRKTGRARGPKSGIRRSEEHTSELQSPCNLVCRLLLEKKKAALPEDPCRRELQIITRPREDRQQ